MVLPPGTDFCYRHVSLSDITVILTCTHPWTDRTGRCARPRWLDASHRLGIIIITQALHRLGIAVIVIVIITQISHRLGVIIFLVIITDQGYERTAVRVNPRLLEPDMFLEGSGSLDYQLLPMWAVNHENLLSLFRFQSICLLGLS
jgi:hypothetical protein